MDIIFGSISAEQRQADIEKRQKGNVVSQLVIFHVSLTQISRIQSCAVKLYCPKGPTQFGDISVSSNLNTASENLHCSGSNVTLCLVVFIQ